MTFMEYLMARKVTLVLSQRLGKKHFLCHGFLLVQFQSETTYKLCSVSRRGPWSNYLFNNHAELKSVGKVQG